MATLTVNGQKVTVDDSFLHLSHDEQQATVDEIATKLKPAAAPPDKYQQAAIDDNEQLRAMGAPDTQGFGRRLTHGATFGADTTLAALATTPAEMIRHGTFDPTEGYSYAKARQDLDLAEARKKTGALGTAAEIAGGGMSGAGLASAGVTAARMLAPEAGIIPRALASAADAAGIGGFSGAMEGNGTDRIANAAKGAGVGAALGGLAPFALAGVKAIASPVISNINARINPEGFAQGQVARAIQESGRTPNEIALDTIQAGNEGQGAYTVADAMGNAGQRMLSTVARAPGAGRTAVVDALEARQADQGRRVSGALAEGFGTPQTAAQTEARMTAARNTAADAEYGAVRNDANPVDMVGTINHIDRIIGTGPGQQLQAPNDGIEAVLRGFRERLARVNPDDFSAVQRIRGEMADAAQNAAQNGFGNRARLIRGAVGELDTAMENASAGHLQANRNFAQSSRNIEAVDQGRAAATRGRTEDTIPAFQALPPEGQQAFRTGYVDPLIAQTQGAAFGANKARPFTSDAFRDEAAAIAPQDAMMQRRLGREMTMFETRNQASGGSKTIDNANDHAAMGISPEFVGFVGNVLHGNVGGAVRTALHAGSNLLTGNTPQVRQAVANILLQRGPNMNPATLENMVNQVVARMQHVNRIVANLGRGAAGGVAVEGPGQKRQ